MTFNVLQIRLKKMMHIVLLFCNMVIDFNHRVLKGMMLLPILPVLPSSINNQAFWQPVLFRISFLPPPI
jgi:hypothetical protein